MNCIENMKRIINTLLCALFLAAVQSCINDENGFETSGVENDL